MARIATIQNDLFRIPLEKTLADAMHGEMKEFEVITCRVTDEDGAMGMGYTFTCGRNGRAIKSILDDEISEITNGKDANRIEHIWEKIWWQTHYGGRGGPTVFAISAFDMALWDLKAKRANLPLWDLLGGHDNKVSCYAGGIDLHLSAPELVEQSIANHEHGFRALKMKVGRENLSEDVAKLSAMRDHFGDSFPLMVDANMKWTAAQAIRAANAFTEFDPIWLEEPIIPDDVQGHATIAAQSMIPIATGENFRTIWEFQNAITVGKISFPEPDVTNCGGITPFMKVAHLVESFNLPVTSHGAHDVTVHLLAAAPNGQYLEAHGFGLDAYIENPLVIENGNAIAPDRPGHGINFDFDKLSHLNSDG